jgi:putative transposase
MPRPPRRIAVGLPVHVVNRANDRRQIFRNRPDYEEFLRCLEEAASLFAVELHGYCLMPNHFHLLLCQRASGAVSAYMHRITGHFATVVRRWTGTVGCGHVFQRRFWSRVVAGEQAYLATLRYIEANAVRAKLATQAVSWEWGSLWERQTGGRRLLAVPLVSLPRTWHTLVDQPFSDQELEALRHPVRAGRPKRAAAQTPEMGPGPFSGP